MSSRPDQSRNTGLAVTAGTLIALMMIGAAMSATPAAGAMPCDARTGVREDDAVKAMYAAVAAVARNLAGGERIVHAGPVLAMVTELPDPLIPVIGSTWHSRTSHLTLIGRERLDLPPPTC